MRLFNPTRGRRACLSALTSALLLGSLASWAADIPTAAPASKGLSAERLARIRPVIQAK